MLQKIRNEIPRKYKDRYRQKLAEKCLVIGEEWLETQQKITRYVTSENKDKLYQIYNILKELESCKTKNDLILIYNKIVKIITNKIIESFDYNDIQFFNNIYKYSALYLGK